MKILKWILKVIAVLVVSFVMFLLYAQFSDYKPDPIEDISTTESTDSFKLNTSYNILNWNIGYSGLGDDMDFFYDGGEQVRCSKERVHENFNSISKFIVSNDTIDLYLLQEVDIRSKRSYRLNQFEKLGELLKINTFSGINYKVTFVPMPVSNPLGKVYSGLVSFTKQKPFDVKRYSFPGNYSWPTSLFMLDRCFLVKRFHVENGKEFIVINTHNSAYDDGTLKEKQMNYLRKFLLDEFNKGNYVVVGGDWNQNPPYYKEEKALKRGVMNNINPNYLPEWQWVYKTDVPTNRYLDEVYVEGQTNTTVIDYYLMSPNIHVKTVKNIDLHFKNSDHQPVLVQIELN